MFYKLVCGSSQLHSYYDKIYDQKQDRHMENRPQFVKLIAHYLHFHSYLVVQDVIYSVKNENQLVQCNK